MSTWVFIYDDQDHFDLDLVIKNLELALEQDGDYPMTHENSGSPPCHRQVPQDIADLGNCSHNFDLALTRHQFALNRLEEVKSDNDAFLRGSKSM